MKHTFLIIVLISLIFLTGCVDKTNTIKTSVDLKDIKNAGIYKQKTL